MGQTHAISREEAVALLARDTIRHFSMSVLLKDALEPECHQAGNSLLVRTPDDHRTFAFLVNGDAMDALPLFDLLDGTETLFYVQGDVAANRICERVPIGRNSDCMQFYLPQDVPITEDEEGIVDLSSDHAEYIHSHYSYRDVTTVAYLRDRIEKAPAIGMMIEGVLAGFVMTHEEMTMGVMHVLPEYRRLGLGKKLNAALVRRMRALGLPCIVEIVHDNSASLALAKSTGYIPIQKVHWMHRKNG